MDVYGDGGGTVCPRTVCVRLLESAHICGTSSANW